MTKRKLPNILLIEDNGMFLTMQTNILDGYKVYTAMTGDEGIKLFKNKKPDIVFLDIGLPDMSGHAVLNAIKKIDKDAYIVMITASRLKNDIEEALNEGAKGYVMKPFSSKRIEECITKYYQYIESHV